MPASVIESPISDAKLAALGVSREKMLERIRSAVSFATGAGIRVAFFGVDSSRADLDFYRRAYDTAPSRPARRRSSSSTRSGSRRPRRRPTSSARPSTGSEARSPCTGTGTTTSGSARRRRSPPCRPARPGCRGRSTAWASGPGNADLLEVALALEALYGIPTRLDLTQARSLSQLVQERAGTPLPSWKAVTGDALFTRESGAVAAQFHDPPAIEPYSSELVGATRGIVLGKKSGIDSITHHGRAARARRPGGAACGAARSGEGPRCPRRAARQRRRVPRARGAR